LPLLHLKMSPSTRRERRTLPTRLGSAALLALLVASCTLLGSRDVVQCRRDSDCTAPNRPVCQNDLCVARALVDASIGDGSAEGAAPACTKPEDCPQVGNPQVCVQNTCRDVRSARCPNVYPNNERVTSDTVLFGYFVDRVTKSELTNAVETAVTQVRTVFATPKVMTVLCKKAAAERATVKDEVVGHLADIGAPVIIGDFESAELRDLAPFVRERKIGIWSTLGNASIVQDAALSNDLYRFFVDEPRNLDYQAALDLAVARTGVARPTVAVIANDALESVELVTKLLDNPGLLLDGAKLAADRFSIKGNYDTAGFDYLKTSQAVTPTTPRIIILIGGQELAVSLLPILHPALSNPREYILPPRSRRDLADLIKLRSDFRSQMIGVDFGGDPTNHARYVDKYRSTYAADEYGGIYDYLYDTTLVATFAATVALAKQPAPKGPITAEQLRDALKAIDSADVGAPLFQVGDSELINAFGPLSRGSPIRYTGATGPLTFNPAGNGRTMTTAFYCFKPPGAGTNLVYYVPFDDVNRSTMPVCAGR
jgi:hypothetical protein